MYVFFLSFRTPSSEVPADGTHLKLVGYAEVSQIWKQTYIFLSPAELSFCTNSARNSGAIAPCSMDLLTEVGRRLSAATGDARETAFLFQRISVALQRFNAVLIHESFVAPDVEPDL